MRIIWIAVILWVGIGLGRDVILDTSFEEYPVGSLPDGFVIIYDGKGENYQGVVNNKAYSGSKSFRV